MSFVLVDRIRVEWPVTVLVPSTVVPGELVSQTFNALFEPVTADEGKRLDEEYRALPIEGQIERQDELLKRFLVGWNGVTSPSGADIPFSAEALHQALQFPWFRNAVYGAYRQMMAGEKPRLGN